MLAWISVGVLLIRKLSLFRDSSLHPSFFRNVFLLKIAAGMGMAALYTYYYTDRSTADIFKYFDDSRIMYDALWHKPEDYFRMLFGFDSDLDYFKRNYYNEMNFWFRQYENELYNDSHTIIRINAFFRLFSMGYYSIHTVLACFLSMVGLALFYRAVKRLIPGKEKALAIVIFLFPSVLFWGSGMLKESFLLGALGVLMYAFLFLFESPKAWRRWIWLFPALAFLLYLKVYVLLALIPGLFAYAWVRCTGNRNVWLKHLTVYLSAVALFLCWSHLSDYPLYEILAYKQTDFIRLADAMESGSIVSVYPLDTDPLTFLKAAPKAFANVFFRPFPGESFSPLMLLAGFENLCILLACVAAFRFRNSLAPAQRNLLFLCVGMVVLLFVLIGWVTPVMGAIVRYKVPALPFLGIALVLIMDMIPLRGLFLRKPKLSLGI